MYATIVLMSAKVIHLLGQIGKGVYNVLQKGEKVMDWLTNVIDKYPDPNVVIDKLGKVNGHDKAKGGGHE